MKTDTKLNAIKILEDRIAKHRQWAEYFEKHLEKETDPEFKKLGNALFHRQCIKEYQFIISQFNKAVKALDMWNKVQSERSENNPCPDYGLMAIYRKEAIKLTTEALT